jgi:CHASE3 domain sensor protein
MATPMLRRFVISYSAMLIVMVAVSSYSVLQLGRLSAAAHTAVSIEQRMIDQADGLADAFLSEVRYGGKFSVTQAPVHYEQYEEFKTDFERRMGQLKTLATSADAVQRLSQTEEYHAQYHQLFEREVEYIKKKQPYAESRYREEKERLVDYLLREHAAFKGNLEKSLQQRIGYIERAAQESQNFTLAATLLLAILGIVLACWLGGRLPSHLLTSVDSPIAALVLHLRPSSWWKGFGVPK